MKLSKMLLGFALGALVGLMFAPKPGDEMRQDMKSAWDEFSEGDGDPAAVVKDFVNKVVPGCCESETVETIVDAPFQEV